MGKVPLNNAFFWKMTPFIDFQFCVWESDAVAHAIVRHNETAYQTAFLICF